MKDNCVEIKTIGIVMGDKTINISIEDARKLKKALDELFGEKVVERYHTKEIVRDNYNWWNRPYQVTYGIAPGIDNTAKSNLPFLTCNLDKVTL